MAESHMMSGMDGRPQEGPVLSSRVYVGNLPWNVDENALRDAFKHIGPITEAKVIYERETGRSKGFGFITFARDEDSKVAIETMSGRDIGGRLVKVNGAQPPGTTPRRIPYFRGGPPGPGGYGGGPGYGMPPPPAYGSGYGGGGYGYPPGGPGGYPGGDYYGGRGGGMPGPYGAPAGGYAGGYGGGYGGGGGGYGGGGYGGGYGGGRGYGGPGPAQGSSGSGSGGTSPPPPPGSGLPPPAHFAGDSGLGYYGGSNSR